MGRDLTKRYLVPSENKRSNNPFLFLRDLYRYGKVSEFSSFAIWELCHRLGLFPKERYLKFSSDEPLTLENEELNDPDFSSKVVSFFKSKGLAAVQLQHNWKLLFADRRGEILGCLYPDDRDLYKSTDSGESLKPVTRFPESIKAVFVSSEDTIFVCVEGALYRSSDAGISFKKALDLGSPASFFRHNNAMTETPSGTLIIGEYGNVWDRSSWRSLAYLYSSCDEGETWKVSDFLIERGTNKHVHLVKYSQLLDRVLIADGDNYKKLWQCNASDASDLKNPRRWRLVNRFHIQMGGYTSLVESDGKLLFGTDYQGGTNFIVETRDCRTFSRKIVPDPYRRSPVGNMVQRNSRVGHEIWAQLPYSTRDTRSLLMYTADGGESWTRVIEYDRATHKVWLVNATNGSADALFFSIEDNRSGDRATYKVVSES